MPRTAKPLTIATIDNAIRKAVGKSRKGRDFPLWDGQGLHLIDRQGRFHWRLKYTRPDGRENRLALGQYPAVSLADARVAAGKARAQLRAGTDPGAALKAKRDEERRKVVATFERFAREWIKIKSPGWAQSTKEKAELALNGYLIPAIGRRDVRDITSRDVVDVLRKMPPSIVPKAAGAAQYVLRVAITAGARDEGRLLDLNLRDNLPRAQRGHYSAATAPAEVKAVMDAVKAIASEVTRAALLVCAYTAQRPGDVAAMRWSDVDTKGAEWIIPKTKTGQSHVVPLSLQALALTEAMQKYTAGAEYVFPPLARQKSPHLHRDSLSKALREAGLKGKQTPHGLRATLRTVARERLGISADVLEAQLAHAKRGEVAAAYDRTAFVEERQRVMQAWADYLDGASRDTVTPIRRNG
jgi:integrase